MDELETVIRFEDDRDILKEWLDSHADDLTWVSIVVEDISRMMPEVGHSVKWNGEQHTVTEATKNTIVLEDDEGQSHRVPTQDFLMEVFEAE